MYSRDWQRNMNNCHAMPCCVGQSGHWLHTDNYVKTNCFQHALVCRDSQVDLLSHMIHFQFVSLKTLDSGWTWHLSGLSLPGIIKKTKCLGAVMIHDQTKSAFYLIKLRPFTCWFIYCLNFYKSESITLRYRCCYNWTWDLFTTRQVTWQLVIAVNPKIKEQFQALVVKPL